MNRVSGVFAALFADPTRALVVLTLVLVGLLGALGLRAPHLVRIGVRNVGRRRLRTGLIVFGLMLSTTFVAAALAVDDTITLAVKTVAVFNLGRADAEVLGASGQLGLCSSSVGGDMVAALRGSGEVAGVAPVLRVPDILVADTTAHQVRSGVAALGMDSTDAGPLAKLHAAHNVSASPDALASDELYLN